ncbi:hypothetical protein AAHE18_13G355300 [Arachis hypogaea]|nr:uncharacterized protein DS421_13g434800 [Arachis hypogaea]
MRNQSICVSKIKSKTKKHLELLLCFDLPVATAICFICTTVPTRELITNEASMVNPMQVQHHSDGFLFFCCQDYDHYAFSCGQPSRIKMGTPYTQLAQVEGDHN